MKRIIVLGLVATMVIGVCHAQKNQQKDFSGVITYNGKVSRIPDKKKTDARLNENDGTIREYMNSDFTKREEVINGELLIKTVNGNKDDVWWQTLQSSKNKGVLLFTSTRAEQMKYSLLPKDAKCNSAKVLNRKNKKMKVCGHECTKVICNMVTTDNIRVQLVAWVATDMRIKGRITPYFGELSGVPLKYDYYNGRYVVTYTAEKIEKGVYGADFFEKPSGENVEVRPYSESGMAW